MKDKERSIIITVKGDKVQFKIDSAFSPMEAVRFLLGGAQHALALSESVVTKPTVEELAKLKESANIN